MLQVKLIGEAAEILIEKLCLLKVPFDAHLVRLGVALPDAGKNVFTNELPGKGNENEAAGEEILLANGIDEKLARCRQSHGKWQTMDC